MGCNLRRTDGRWMGCLLAPSHTGGLAHAKAGEDTATLKPLCIDLFCGLGGWTEGFLAEGYDCIGFDIERHRYTKPLQISGVEDASGRIFINARPERLAKYPGQLVLQDILTLHGSQFKDASAIVASPPCQAYSWMAMPWSLAKREIRWQEWERDSPFGDFRLNDLFDACFRIQREASEAAGHHIPMVVENVKGAQGWVGRAKWHYGSFYLWGDVPALMPITKRTVKGANPIGPPSGGARATSWFGTSRADPRDMRRNEDGEYTRMGLKVVPGNDTFKRDGRPCNKLTDPRYGSGVKQGGEWWHDPESMTRKFSSRSNSRKAASAQIAKIPLELSAYIARVFKPELSLRYLNRDALGCDGFEHRHHAISQCQ